MRYSTILVVHLQRDAATSLQCRAPRALAEDIHYTEVLFPYLHPNTPQEDPFTMAPSILPSSSWHFGPFRLDATLCCLWRGAQLIPLPPKPTAVLTALVSHHGQMVPKEALLEAVWPKTAVTEGVLKTCIRQIRLALDDTVRAPQYIATVHGRGYRFLAPVTAGEPSAATGGLPPLPAASAGPLGSERHMLH
jgi:DNA-binding winged helix-turn-helix (wHTH) protein